MERSYKGTRIKKMDLTIMAEGKIKMEVQVKRRERSRDRVRMIEGLCDPRSSFTINERILRLKGIVTPSVLHSCES